MSRRGNRVRLWPATWLAGAALLCFLAACRKGDSKSQVAASATPSSSSGRQPDPSRGKKLVTKFECNRCHDGTGLPDVKRERHCVRCHREIELGTFKAKPELLARWRSNIINLRHVPSLQAAGKLLQRDWIVRFLQHPYDLRPHLPATMPRLAISPTEAADIAEYLRTLAKAPPTKAASPALARGDLSLGHRTYHKSECYTCHPMSGAEVTPGRSYSLPGLEAGVALATDLRHTRDGFAPAMLVDWLRDPLKLKQDTAMPQTPMSEPELKSLASFLMRTPLQKLPRRTPPKRLPTLKRDVGYEEVSARVLRKICWHCHAQPDFARGDGGPGMTGGFGFVARKLDLSTYEAVASGYLDKEGERRSAFTPFKDGDNPVLVQVLLNRQLEETGSEQELRGMPLGLPAMSPEQIQLVDSWIEQGRPR